MFNYTIILYYIISSIHYIIMLTIDNEVFWQHWSDNGTARNMNDMFDSTIFLDRSNAHKPLCPCI